jgi:hypothetical protein
MDSSPFLASEKNTKMFSSSFTWTDECSYRRWLMLVGEREKDQEEAFPSPILR